MPKSNEIKKKMTVKEIKQKIAGMTVKEKVAALSPYYDDNDWPRKIARWVDPEFTSNAVGISLKYGKDKVIATIEYRYDPGGDTAGCTLGTCTRECSLGDFNKALNPELERKLRTAPPEREYGHAGSRHTLFGM